ncbi:hypothetical protein JR316_0005999 [Psilocybe cubensis]|uniref:Uncharacterized protein n=2 Tax=Psilocybe cubensis TaxID=181762 RepID=A0A8H8CKW4_PSICU|nr:hypothetical protein JR316_0005999 [Psilocybe cubensis]KAH9481472.1 hypothetical protein JR316_0005999 [Psilocybe cubensis]
MECRDGVNRLYTPWSNKVVTRRIYGYATLASTTRSIRRHHAKERHSECSEAKIPQASHRRLEQRVLGPSSQGQRPGVRNTRFGAPASTLPKADLLAASSVSTPTPNHPKSASEIRPSLSNISKSPSNARICKTTHHTISAIEGLLTPNTPAKKLSTRLLTSLYEDASKQLGVRFLGSERLSAILSLCGSLASSPHPTLYFNILASRYHSDLPKAQLWSFVANVGADKAKSGFELTVEDRYWVMQAHLAKARVAAKNRLKPYLDNLRLQYEQLQNASDAPEAHLPYLRLLVSTRNVTEAIQHLCRVLQRVEHPDPQFPQFLWDVILMHGADISITSKELICSTVSHRINAISSHWVPRSSGILTTPPLIAGVASQGAIGIPHMTAALAAALFPCYNYSGHFLYHWAIQQAGQAFASHLPIEDRWNNILLLATAIHPKMRPASYSSATTVPLNSGNILWRTALALENMNRSFPITGSDYGSLCAKVQAITRPLWTSYSSIKKGMQHVDITRAYISAFLQVAERSFDEQLKGECYRFSKESNLWTFSQNDDRPTKAQAIDLIVAYAKAHISCKGRDWVGCFSAISALVPNLAWQEEVTTQLIQQYSQRKVEIAYDLYVQCLEVGIPIRPEAVNNLFVGLVKGHRWDIITLFLKHSSTTHHQRQFLFGESLRVFQVERYRYVDTEFMKLLAQTSLKLFEHQSPPRSLKYPIRYFLSMMIWSRLGWDMVKLVELLHRQVPDFFTQNLLRALIVQLVRHRQSSQALQLFRIFERGSNEVSSQSLERIRHALMFKLFKQGAYSMARKAIRGETRAVSLTKREALVRRRLSMPTLPASFYQRVRKVALNALAEGSTVKEAVSMLVNGNRLLTARKLYAKCRSTLDVKIRTTIGNMIIHGALQNSGFRNARLVRRVVRMKDLFIKQYGFVPDRATLNIIVKAILNWRTILDAPKVRRLFDTMVHGGYPVPEQFRQENGVPFGSPKRPFNSLPLASLPAGYSFAKHIRPMYKMFIKAFYVRKDVTAAKTVVGILKEVEAASLRELEKRDKARRDGIIKKKLRLRREVEVARKDVK